jgi:hypothetical protein
MAKKMEKKCPIFPQKMPIGASIPFFETHYETAEERKK